MADRGEPTGPPRLTRVIEFVGPSGSGKTTVARAVLALPGAPTWGRRTLAPDPGVTRLGSLTRTAPAVAFIPAIAWRLMRHRGARHVCRRLGLRDTGSVVFNAARNRSQARQGAPSLQDQGLVHGLAHRTRRWAEHERGDGLAAVYTALGVHATPSLIVHFDVAPGVAIERSKMQNPLHHDPAEATIILVAIEQSILAAHQSLGVAVIRTSNSSTVAEAAAELLPMLSETASTSL